MIDYNVVGEGGRVCVGGGSVRDMERVLSARPTTCPSCTTGNDHWPERSLQYIGGILLWGNEEIGIIGVEADGRLDEESGKGGGTVRKNSIPILNAKRLGGVVMDDEV